MDVEITKSDGTKFLLSDHGIHVRDFRVQSPEMRADYAIIEGKSGRVNMGATLGYRFIFVPFYVEGVDLHDFPLVRDKLFALLVDTEPITVRELRRVVLQDGENKYVGGKVYKVRIDTVFDIEQSSTTSLGFGEIAFETTGLPYA